MLFWKSLWKIQLPFSKITKGKGKYIYNPEMNIYSRSGIVKFHFFNSVICYFLRVQDISLFENLHLVPLGLFQE